MIPINFGQHKAFYSLINLIKIVKELKNIKKILYETLKLFYVTKHILCNLCPDFEEDISEHLPYKLG